MHHCIMWMDIWPILKLCTVIMMKSAVCLTFCLARQISFIGALETHQAFGQIPQRKEKGVHPAISFSLRRAIKQT